MNPRTQTSSRMFKWIPIKSVLTIDRTLDFILDTAATTLGDPLK